MADNEIKQPGGDAAGVTEPEAAEMASPARTRQRHKVEVEEPQADFSRDTATATVPSLQEEAVGAPRMYLDAGHGEEGMPQEPPQNEPPPDDEPPVKEPPPEDPGPPPPADDPTLEPPIEEPPDTRPAVRGEARTAALSEPSESKGPEPGDTPPPERVADPQLQAIIESLIFASPEPLTAKMIFKLLESEPKEDVQLAIASLLAEYQRPGGLQLVEIAGGYQIVTRPEMHEWVRRLFHERKTQKLSVQALETLAVIAYKQPVTAPEIGEIRGVNTGGVINTLLERHLIKISGRKAVVGRPFLYSTTREFLIRFGLNDLGDLPKVEDMADVLGFEPPAGLAEAGPSDGRLPLDADSEAPADPRGSASTASALDGKPERVH